MSATITTNARLVTLAVSPGAVINLPRNYPGLEVDTLTALERALEFIDGKGLLDELQARFKEVRARELPIEDAERGFIQWMAAAGDWSE